MAQELYVFDESLGLYGYESRERMAKNVIRDLTRYEETLETVSDPLAELPYLGVDIGRPEEFRLGSLVDSKDACFGYGLALAAPNQADPANMGGVFFLIDRGNGPSVREDKPLLIARPETYTSNQDYKEQVENLMFSFDRGELEAVMRMIGKMTVSLSLANELRSVDEDALAGLSVPARMRRDADTKRNEQALARLSSVEPFVHFAIRHFSKKQLNSLFPSEQPLRHPVSAEPDAPESNEEDTHLLEWKEFTSAAEDLINKEADPDQAVSHTNIQYELDGKLYYIKLVAGHGKLFGAQMLCDRTGAWKSQLFDLDNPDDSGVGQNIVSPSFWEKDEIIACLREGEIIDNESYEYYRLLAENSIKAVFESPDNVIHIDEIIKKRPAA